jgi:quercetin dioxygenase-like cupin family protein
MERVNEKDEAYRQGDSGVKYLFRGPRTDWGLIRFLPGEELGRHYHQEVEETFYFVRGEPKMLVNDETIRVREGDAFRLEPGEQHNIVNDTERVVDAIFIKHIHRPKDKVNA